MIYLLFPDMATTVLADNSNVGFSDAVDMSLGGCFYDYLCTVKNDIVGIRYHVESRVRFGEHPVLSQFLKDKRFSFNQEKLFVDIHFDEMPNQDSLHIKTVQDFGGESVINDGDTIGICLRDLSFQGN